MHYQVDRSAAPPPPHVHLGFNLPLVVDGIVGNNTWGRLDPPQIQKNSPQHNYVRLCQLILKSFAVPAFDPGPPDGIFGPNARGSGRDDGSYLQLSVSPAALPLRSMS